MYLHVGYVTNLWFSRKSFLNSQALSYLEDSDDIWSANNDYHDGLDHPNGQEVHVKFNDCDEHALLLQHCLHHYHLHHLLSSL